MLSSAAFLVVSAPVFAHDPPVDAKPLVHQLVEHVLETVPGPVFALFVGLLCVAVLGLSLWLRRATHLFSDRPE